jgi:hypothetical protein
MAWGIHGEAQLDDLQKNNLVWTSQSKNSGESMPCGGGDIGLNVWVENGELLFYASRSGTFDEHNTLLKMGRVRMKFTPNPFSENIFRQELVLKDGRVTIQAGSGKMQTEIIVWVDVFHPVIHVDVKSNTAMHAEALFESWRYQDRVITGRANNANSWKWAPQGEVRMFRDEIDFSNNALRFYHRNKSTTVFDAVVKQQGLDSVKHELYNPLANLTFGGQMQGKNMKPAGVSSGTYANTDYKSWKLKTTKPSRSNALQLFLHTAQSEDISGWTSGLDSLIKKSPNNPQPTLDWWRSFWQRSYIFIKPGQPQEHDTVWQAGRNYQLFRYMLGANAYGTSPTTFNGGLFTYDPVYTDSTQKFTPDFRNWGGGTHTAQNQRLVYFPMVRSGDHDMMKSQFDFYLRMLRNAEMRSKVYWNHRGGSFTEQIENFGLPNPAEYAWTRPPGFDKGMEYNAWLEYQWDTVLEFCLMMLEVERYTKKDISDYLPFIESCLVFFDDHYRYLARQRGRKDLDGNGHLVLYPGSAAETFKMAYNASSTIAALKTVTSRMLALPDTYLGAEKRKALDSFLKRLPPISFAEFNGRKTIAPAKLWERINNTESPQLYPVYPWSIYGMGKPDLEVARNTYLYDTNAVRFRSHVGWKQDNIFAARLGLTSEASRLTVMKLKNSGRRFPAFWGPGYDWTPDHNWGGSGMIGLQEMILQTDGEKILLLPAWPHDWDVKFKLHAPYQTTVEGEVKAGKLVSLKVLPEARRNDVVNYFEQ